MENNNGKGIFYGVIGVATLIVAIIGATFAYFTATTTSGQYITGSAATAGLNVQVVRLTGYSAGEGATSADTAHYVMVPQLDKGLGEALKGSSVTDNQACIDANGSLVCTIYKIIVQNTGSAAIDVSGTIKFYTTGDVPDSGTGLTVTGDDGTVLTDTGSNLMNHLKWARLLEPTTAALASANTSNLLPTTAYKLADAVSATAIPNTLLRYDQNEGVYDTLPDNTTVAYANHAANTNQYLYGRTVTIPISWESETGYSALTTETEQNAFKDRYYDYLGQTQSVGSDTSDVKVTSSHGAHFDLIDPTNDLDASYAQNASKTAATGRLHLAANNQAGDTKALYIVVWISENNAQQNTQDFGTFTGQVTFNSANGSGATSSFTEAYTNAYTD